MIHKKYLTYLGIENEIKTLEDIEFLMKQHLSTFTFSSLSVLLQKELPLDLEEILKRFIDEKTGGYCFEHNKIMYEILKLYGFEVTSTLARVLHNKKDIMPPKTHHFNILNYQGEEYLVDVGFGNMSPSKPIKFSNIPIKATLETSYVIKPLENGVYELQTLTNNTPFTLYSFELQNYHESDFELGHFYSHKHPKAPFVRNLFLCLIKDKVTLLLLNGTFKKTYKNKEEEIPVDTIAHFKHILETQFNYFLTNEELEFLYKKFVLIKS